MEAYFESRKIRKVLAIDPPFPAYDIMRWYLDRIPREQHKKSEVVAFECIVSTSSSSTADVHLGTSPIAGPYEHMADRVVVHRGDPRMVLRGFEFGFPERFQTFDVVHVFGPANPTTLVLVFDLLKIRGTLVTEGPEEGPDDDDEPLIATLETLFGPDAVRLVGRSDARNQRIFVKMRA